MRLLLRLAVQLYPAWWRERYGSEFEGLLSEITPRWSVVVDVFKGALAMRFRTLATLPVVCALAGVTVGAIVASRAPAVYAATATIRIAVSETAGTGNALARELRPSLDSALVNAQAPAAGTTVTLIRPDSSYALLEVTHRNSNPQRAYETVEKLSAAIVAAKRGEAAALVHAPVVPQSPLAHDYRASLSWGGIAGFVLGATAAALLRTRAAATV